MSLVKLTIQGINYSQSQNGAYALILHEVDGERKLPIVIGAFEAQSIAVALEPQTKPSRPITHDLFLSFAQRFDIVIKQVIIHKMVDGIFYSSLICERDGIEEIFDARTSDAISMAVRADAPIFTYKNILDNAGMILNVRGGRVSDNKDKEREVLIKSLVQDANTLDDLSQLSKENLEMRLQEAVDGEDYELAARLRDELDKR